MIQILNSGRRFQRCSPRSRVPRRRRGHSKEARFARSAQLNDMVGALPRSVSSSVTQIPPNTAPSSRKCRVHCTGHIGIAITATGTSPTSLEALISPTFLYTAACYNQSTAITSQYAHSEDASSFFIPVKLSQQFGTPTSGSIFDFLKDTLVCDIICTFFGLNATRPGLHKGEPLNLPGDAEEQLDPYLLQQFTQMLRLYHIPTVSPLPDTIDDILSEQDITTYSSDTIDGILPEQDITTYSSFTPPARPVTPHFNLPCFPGKHKPTDV